MKNVLVRLNEYAKDATEAETNVMEYIRDHADQASVQKCININPLMETMKKNNKAYTATCYSPFTDV